MGDEERGNEMEKEVRVVTVLFSDASWKVFGDNHNKILQNSHVYASSRGRGRKKDDSSEKKKKKEKNARKKKKVVAKRKQSEKRRNCKMLFECTCIPKRASLMFS